MYNVRLIVAAGILLAASGAASSAATTNQIEGFNFSTTIVVDRGNTFGTTQVDQVLEFDQFDPALGTLSGVTFNLTSALEPDPFFGIGVRIFVTGFGSTPIHSVADSEFNLSITDLISGAVIQNQFLNTVECTTGSGLCTAEDEQHSREQYNDSSGVLVNSLAGYEGTGNFDVTLSQMVNLSVFARVAGGGAESSFQGAWSGDLEVVYTYNTVPVPAAAWLFASALGIFGWMRRKAN